MRRRWQPHHQHGMGAHEDMHSHQHMQPQRYDGLTKNCHQQKATIDPPLLAPFTHLKKSVINETITKANEAILLLLKKQPRYDENHVIHLLKYFHIPVPKAYGCQVDLNMLSEPDFM
jgi:hypothetical protein